MQLVRGKIAMPQKVVIYGPEGVGKSTLAAAMPKPLFIDTEGSTYHLDVARTPKPENWRMLLAIIDEAAASKGEFKTLIIDTADWAEALAREHVCRENNVTAIGDKAYGVLYAQLGQQWEAFLAKLNTVIAAGLHVVLTSHAGIVKFEQPDEAGQYDRFALKLYSGFKIDLAAKTKEWADMVLFCNYRTVVVTDKDTKKKRAAGGERVMYTTHHPAWDAKNRHGLPDELPMEFNAIAHCYVSPDAPDAPASTSATTSAPQETAAANFPAAMYTRMTMSGITTEEMEAYLQRKGFLQPGQSCHNLGDGFVNAMTSDDNWQKVVANIEENRK